MRQLPDHRQSCEPHRLLSPSMRRTCRLTTTIDLYSITVSVHCLWTSRKIVSQWKDSKLIDHNGHICQSVLWIMEPTPSSIVYRYASSTTTGWPKKASYILCWIFQRIGNIFKNSFTVNTQQEICNKRSLQIPHFNGVATLPCEIINVW